MKNSVSSSHRAIKLVLGFIFTILLPLSLFQNCGGFESAPFGSLDDLNSFSVFDVPAEPGTGTVGAPDEPYNDPVNQLAGEFVNLNGTTCYINTQGGLSCVGDNSNYQFGNGTTAPSSKAVQVLPSPVEKIIAAPAGSGLCAIANADLYCWGEAFKLALTGDVYKRPSKIAADVIDAAFGFGGLFFFSQGAIWQGQISNTSPGGNWLTLFASQVTKLLPLKLQNQICYISQNETYCTRNVIQNMRPTIEVVKLPFANFERFWDLENGILCAQENNSLKCSLREGAPKEVLAGQVTHLFRGGGRSICASVDSRLQCWGPDALGLIAAPPNAPLYNAYQHLMRFLSGEEPQAFLGTPQVFAETEIDFAQWTTLPTSDFNMFPFTLCWTDLARNLNCVGSNLSGLFQGPPATIQKTPIQVATDVTGHYYDPALGFCYKTPRDLFCRTSAQPGQDWHKITVSQEVSSLDFPSRDHCFVGDGGSVFCNNMKISGDLVSSGGFYVKVIESGASQIIGHPSSAFPTVGEICLVIHNGDLKNCRETYTGAPLPLATTVLRNVQRFSYRYPDSTLFAQVANTLVYALVSDVKAGSQLNPIELSNNVKTFLVNAILTLDNKIQRLNAISRTLSTPTGVNPDTVLIDPHQFNTTFYISNRTLYGTGAPLNQPADRLFVGSPHCALSEGRVFCQITSEFDAQKLLTVFNNNVRWDPVFVGGGATDFRTVEIDSTFAMCLIRDSSLFCKGRLGSRDFSDWTFLRAGVKSFYENRSFGFLIVRTTNGDLESYRQSLLPTAAPTAFVRIQNLRQ